MFQSTTACRNSLRTVTLTRYFVIRPIIRWLFFYATFFILLDSITQKTIKVVYEKADGTSHYYVSKKLICARSVAILLYKKTIQGCRK